MNPYLELNAALWRATADALGRQMRLMQVMQEAAFRQGQVFWGLRSPSVVANIRAPGAGLAPARRTVPELPEPNDLPV